VKLNGGTIRLACYRVPYRFDGTFKEPTRYEPTSARPEIELELTNEEQEEREREAVKEREKLRQEIARKRQEGR